MKHQACFYSIILGLIFSVSLYSQDLAFNQYSQLGFKLNPALTGDFDGKIRVTSHLRDIRKKGLELNPQNTFTTFADAAIFKNEKGWFGVGLGYRSRLQVVLDDLGELEFMDMDVKEYDIALAYHRLVETANGGQHQISFGSVFNISSYDDSPINDMWDPDFVAPHLSLGVDWKLVRKSGVTYQSSVSAYHLNRPNISFLSEGEVKLPLLFHHYSSVRIPILDNLILEPSYLIAQHNSVSSLTLGVGMDYQFVKLQDLLLGWEVQYRRVDNSFINQQDGRLGLVLFMDWKWITLSYASEYATTLPDNGNPQEVLLALKF